MDYRSCPKFIEAERYLSEKRIPELLNNLTSLVIFNKPENPFQYMVSILERLKAAQHGRGDNPFIFTLSNAESIFHMLDPNMRGYITYQQYKHGLETLGITEFDIVPRGIGNNAITKEVFLAEAQKGLDNLSSTYQRIPGFPTAHVEKDQREETKLDQYTC
ncbi:EF-hand calcium-binding domain-containing protein 10 [Taenia crassiceps]|uniref:EF-hand calcium-binding domain-containing protein 10 n=1 Tax=Taenia crassiceps TaxID=6207 RepID=A0ABR4QPY0_9CEST